MHLFLSPHADDAALSCGAQIAQLTRSGEHVIVLTIMAGDPPPHFPATTFSRELWARWSAGDAPTVRRRNEDVAAATTLGAAIRFGLFPDAVYRLDRVTAQPLYTDRAAIFGDVQPNDPVPSSADLPALEPGDVLHAPLGVGHHVDHLIVRDAAIALSMSYPSNLIFFYEDYPYTSQDGDAVQAALQDFKQPVARVGRPADERAIDTKIASIACYRSQLSSFWASEAVMADEIHIWMRDRGEVEWQLLRETARE